MLPASTFRPRCPKYELGPITKFGTIVNANKTLSCLFVSAEYTVPLHMSTRENVIHMATVIIIRHNEISSNERCPYSFYNLLGTEKEPG
jgi:hypothetical protein